MRLEIAGRVIAPDVPPYVIAEAGVHHYNSLELARMYVLQARIAGVDAIKFQTYSANRLATTWATTYWNDPSGKSQFEIFAERSRLSREDYAALFSYARELGVHFLSTPFDTDAAEMLAGLGMSAFKIASADLTHFPLLECVASFKRPMLLSTGAATFAEVDKTVEFLRARDAHFALLHCVLAYPTAVADANLRRIGELRLRYPEILIGYSDHTRPVETVLSCPLAVALGARIIEKHFTLNRGLDGDDHYHAEDGPGLARLVRDCKDAFMMTRTPTEMKDSELPARLSARRSIVAARGLAAGRRLTREDLDFKRPGTGLPPTQLDRVLGRVLARDVTADELIAFDQFVD
jgi:N-acetylneuraminate synthase